MEDVVAAGDAAWRTTTTRRRLTITKSPEWRAALQQAGKAGRADRYQGETLDFESPGAFFGRLTERRWALVTALQGQGAMAVRELARRAGRDVKRVHEDVQVLTALGLVERDDAGGVLGPFADVHIDTPVHREDVAACTGPGWAADGCQAALCVCWHAAK